MKFLKSMIKWTLCYKLYSVIYSFYLFVKDYNIVSDFLYSETFLKILKKYLNKDFRKDWIGRLYAVINPNIDIDGKLNFNNTIIELDDERTNNDIFVQNWIFKQLQLVADIFKIENLYSYISLTVKHVGPKHGDNYLVIFEITSKKYFIDCCKRFFGQLLIYLIIFAILFIYISVL